MKTRIYAAPAVKGLSVKQTNDKADVIRDLFRKRVRKCVRERVREKSILVRFDTDHVRVRANG